LKVTFKTCSKRASVNLLAGFLKPQSPAERLAAQELEEEARGKGKGRGCDEEARGAPVHAAPTSLLLFPHLRLPLVWLLLHVKPSPLFPCFCAASASSATASASAAASASSTNSRSSAQPAFTRGLSNSKNNSQQDPSEVLSNSKFNPKTPSRTEIENLKCGPELIVNERYI